MKDVYCDFDIVVMCDKCLFWKLWKKIKKRILYMYYGDYGVEL